MTQHSFAGVALILVASASCTVAAACRQDPAAAAAAFVASGDRYAQHLRF
jgi:hypothetical protein